MKAAASIGARRRPAPSLLVFTIATLAVLVAICGLLIGRTPANPQTHFSDTNVASPPALGGLGAVALPPSL